jgi:hypothetical protein
LPYHGSQIAYDYEFGDDSTTVRVDDDPSSVVIDGGAPASFDIAWRMQQNYPEPIRLIDGQYSFDLLLNGFDSTAALTEAVEKEEWC